MSLFEDDSYRWRETYFVLFHESERPDTERIRQALQSLGRRYELSEPRLDEEGRFESITLRSPADFAALDISYIAGEDVIAHVIELQQELRMATLTGDEIEKVQRLAECNARFDIYHFEEVMAGGDDPDEFLDPGALLVVLEKLASLCNGIGIDPQSGSIVG